MPDLTLISHALCPYVQRAVIALTEKGVPFERVDIDLAAKPDWFRALSPLGKVPLLRVAEGERRDALFESAAICEYLEETQPGPRLHPADPVQRARHRAWIDFASAMLGDLWGFETAREAGIFEAMREALAAKFDIVEAALEEGLYFGGRDFSLVDAAFGPVFRYFDVFERLGPMGVLDGKPKIAAWRAALAARPSVRAAVRPDYPDLLRAFLARHDAYLLRFDAGRAA